MEIKKGILRKSLKNIFLMADYLAWMLADPSKFKIVKKNEIKKVLFIHTGAIGELIVTTPLVKALKKSLGCEIVYMISKGREPLLAGNPNISKIITYEDDFKKNLAKIRKENFDLALVFRAFFKQAYLCWRAGIKYRIGGFGGLNRSPSFLFTRRINPVCNKHVLECNLDMVRQMNIEPCDKKTEVFVSEKDRKSVEKRLASAKIKSYVIVHPGFGKTPRGYNDPERLWPTKKYAEVINQLLKKYKFKIILTGLEEEKELTEKILREVNDRKRVFDSCGLFNIGEMIPLINKARLFIAPDTGLGHVAAAFEVPLVNLEGRSGPDEWGPVGNPKIIKNIYHPEKIIIRPSLNKPVKSIGGLQAITPAEVIKAAEELLKK